MDGTSERPLEGLSLIGAAAAAPGDRTFHGTDARFGERLDPGFHAATPADVERATWVAESAFVACATSAPAARAALLRRIDGGNPDRSGRPQPDVHSMHRLLGPGARFGASNFPLPFSVAARSRGMPSGPFSLLFDDGNAVGQALVRNALVRAVGVTGSHAGEQALMRLAAEHPEPIPITPR